MNAHLKAQLLRFARTTGYAFAGALFATGGHVKWWDALSLLAGAAETGLRQVFKVKAVQTWTVEPAPPDKG